MKTNVAVFYGCRSVEHEVSIISAVQAMHSIDREKYDVTPVYVTKSGEMYTGEKLFTIEEYRNLPELLKNCKKVNFARENGKVLMKYENSGLFSKQKTVAIDVAFPVVHGTNCEDGTIQGFFEFLDLPYVGCDIISSAVGMDKAVFKDVLKNAGLPVLDCLCYRAREYMTDKENITNSILNKIGLPLIVKPVNLGSSVGISKVNTEAELDEALTLAFSFADKVLVEHAVTAIREINCSVLGNADNCEASVCEEPFMNDEILSYEDKYMGNSKNGGQSKGMASLGRKIPADLSEDKSNEIRTLACNIFKAIGANGVVRIDFIIDTDTDTVYANEINTIPGSLAFYLWDPTGVPYKELINRLIDLAFKRQRNRDNLTYTIDTNILSGVSFGGAKGAKGSKI
ncbi:MAG: D-alanine--D-alanine ligase family protein [Acutalibacteraceae bacterium]|nr:D-alanine--D-alanine ligase family protein [Acutalibacteraceae bacterium]